MSDNPCNVLFLCRANATLSLMAESLLRHWGEGRFNAYSAGLYPEAVMHPKALALLEMMKLPTSGLQPKGWGQFSELTSPRIDLIIILGSVFPEAVAPKWQGQPVIVNWRLVDPVGQEGTQRVRLLAFRNALLELEQRIKALITLPASSLDKTTLGQYVDEIGRTGLVPRY